MTYSKEIPIERIKTKEKYWEITEYEETKYRGNTEEEQWERERWKKPLI